MFVLGWARVRRVSLSSELLMCGGGVRSILLLPLVARCLETIDVCIWRMFVFMSVVFSVCIVRRGAVGARVLCASCGSSQCCVLHDLQFVNAGRGCNGRPYRRGILQSRSHNCFIGSHGVSFCLPHPVAVSAFTICRGLCACTEMLWICVLYVSFGSKVRPRTFGCVAMGSTLLCIVSPDC